MKKGSLILFVTVIITVVLSGCSGVSSDYMTFDQQVKEELPKMVWLLQQDKRGEFIEQYSSFEWIKDKGGVDKVLIEFTPDKAAILIEALKRAEGMTPTIDSKNVLVTFDGPAFPRPLVFKKEIGKWRLLNN